MGPDLSSPEIDTRTHRVFLSDLPALAGQAATEPVNVRAALLQRDLERAQAANAELRAVVLDLMELAADKPELLAKAHSAFLRAVL